MGRPSDYNQEIAATLCERIADGKSLRSICDDEEMPAKSSVFKWLILHPEFADQYASAREAQADSHADDMTDIADDKDLPVDRARLMVDTRKWVASKLKAKKYGDKVETTHVGDRERPIFVNPVDVDL